jgi:hypothetical protein
LERGARGAGRKNLLAFFNFSCRKTVQKRQKRRGGTTAVQNFNFVLTFKLAFVFVFVFKNFSAFGVGRDKPPPLPSPPQESF